MDRDEPEALPILDLDDDELGVHREDRYAAIPPGPRLIRRRDRPPSSGAGAIALLAGLAVLFLAATWLSGLTDDGDSGGRDPIPALERPTGASVVLLGSGGVATLEVDSGRVTPLALADLPVAVRDAAVRGHGIVTVGDRARFLDLPDERVLDLGRASGLVASERAVWITRTHGDVTHARSVRADGTLGDSFALDGALVALTGERLVIARPDSLAIVDAAAGTTVDLGAELEVVATSDTLVAAGVAGCAGQPCDLLLFDPSDGSREVLDDVLGQPGLRTAAFSPDGEVLAITFSDGIVARGVLVEVASGRITRFSTDSVRREQATLAWSEDGDWLFLAVERGRIQAVDRAGRAAVVPADLPRFDVLLPEPASDVTDAGFSDGGSG